MADLLISTPDGDFSLPAQVQSKLAAQMSDPANIIGAKVSNVASTSRDRANHTGKQDPLTSLSGATGTGVAVLTASSQAAARGAIDAASVADVGSRLRPTGLYKTPFAYAVNDLIVTSTGQMFYALLAHTATGAAPTATTSTWQAVGGTGGGSTFVPSYDNALAGTTFTLVAPFPTSRPSTRTDISFLLKGSSSDADPTWLLPIDTRLVVG